MTHVYSLWRDLSIYMYTKIFDFVTLTVTVGFVTPLFWGCVLLYLRSAKGGCCSISDDLSCSFTYILVPENLTWRNFWTLEVGVSYFICTFLVMRPFRSYHNCWPCDLHRDLWPTYLETLIFAITFEPLVVRLSYFTCTCLVMRPFCSYQFFDLCDLDRDLSPIYLKMWNRKISISQIGQLLAQGHYDCPP